MCERRRGNATYSKLTLAGTKWVNTAGQPSLSVTPKNVVDVVFGDIVRIDTVVGCVALGSALASRNGALVVVTKEANQMTFTIVVRVAVTYV